MEISFDQAQYARRNAVLVHAPEAVNAAVARIAGELNHALRDANPLVLCVMRGALVFAGQLLPQLDFPLEVDVIDVTRYGNTTHGGELVLRAIGSLTSVAGRSVLLLDDILDKGVTLAALRDKLLEAGAQRVWTAVFAVKDTVRIKPVTADFFGVAVPDRYVFGFGMDVQGYWRNLPAVYALNEG
jgi:hypoxanthine phosphoribosyltransferase